MPACDRFADALGTRRGAVRGSDTLTVADIELIERFLTNEGNEPPAGSDTVATRSLTWQHVCEHARSHPDPEANYVHGVAMKSGTIFVLCHLGAVVAWRWRELRGSITTHNVHCADGRDHTPVLDALDVAVAGREHYVRRIGEPVHLQVVSAAVAALGD